MRLLAPPAVTDDRIAQTKGTPANDLFAQGVAQSKPGLQWSGKSGIEGDGTPLGGSRGGRNLARICRPEKSLPPSCLTQHVMKDNSDLLALWYGVWPIKPPRVRFAAPNSGRALDLLFAKNLTRRNAFAISNSPKPGNEGRSSS